MPQFTDLAGLTVMVEPGTGHQPRAYCSHSEISEQHARHRRLSPLLADHCWFRRSVVELLEEIADPALPALREPLTSDGHAEVREAARRTSGQIEGRSVWLFLKWGRLHVRPRCYLFARVGGTKFLTTQIPAFFPESFG